eukprot:7103621-Prymnesium_polylepis.1
MPGVGLSVRISCSSSLLLLLESSYSYRVCVFNGLRGRDTRMCVMHRPYVLNHVHSRWLACVSYRPLLGPRGVSRAQKGRF